MKIQLYHGSSVPEINHLNAFSKLHGRGDVNAVYLTESFPYSLFYIWDIDCTGTAKKHISCWIKKA